MKQYLNEGAIDTEINKEKLVITTCEDEINQKRLIIAKSQQRVKDLQIQKKTLQDKSRHLELKISDHALICYMERYKGIDMNAIRAEMKQQMEEAVVYAYGSGRVPFANGYCVVNNFSVITFINKDNQEV